MSRIRNNNKRWRLRWPWRLIFPLKVDQRNCPECGLPYHEGPLPREVDRFNDGNVEALVFPAGGFRRNEFAVRFGRWKGGNRGFFLADYIPENELDSLIEVAKQAKAAYDWRTKDRRTRRY